MGGIYAARRAVTAIPARKGTMVVTAKAGEDVNTGFFQKYGINTKKDPTETTEPTAPISDSITRSWVDIPEELGGDMREKVLAARVLQDAKNANDAVLFEQVRCPHTVRKEGENNLTDTRLCVSRRQNLVCVLAL